MIVYNKKDKYIENVYRLESEFEKEIFDNFELFFGKNSILIDAKKKIESNNLGNSIPDGFLLNFKNKKNPEFYLIEVELVTHDFYRHIFPQITKFFAFLKTKKNQSELIEKVYNIVETTPELKEKYLNLSGKKEIYKSLKDIVENNSSILLIIDGDKPELPEILDTYTDTWGEYVKIQKIQRFNNVNNKDYIFTVEPEFEYLDYTIEIEKSDDIDSDKYSNYTEENHLEKVNPDVRENFEYIKSQVFNYNQNAVFNPRKYYIALRINKNIAFFKFSRKRFRIILMKPFDEVAKLIKNYEVVELVESVQKFWNGPSCAVLVENNSELDNIIEIIKSIDKEANGS